MDTDASNTIEAKELADGLKAQGYNISQQELAQLMGRVDFDRNGTLDLEEFISGLIDWTEVTFRLPCGLVVKLRDAHDLIACSEECCCLSMLRQFVWW